MDFKHYDVEGAVEQIDRLSTEKVVEEGTDWQVEDGIHLAREDAMPLFQPVRTGISSCHRLLYNIAFLKEHGILVSGNVEVVGHVHGVVTYVNMDGPTEPFNGHSKIPERILTITGLKSAAFDKVIKSILAIDELFAKTHPTQRWIPWRPGNVGQYPTVRFATRVLTPTYQCHEAKVIPIPDGHDQSKVLKKLVAEGQFRFLGENEVKVFRYDNCEGEETIVNGSLDDIRQGVVVHCQVSFCSVKTRDGDQLMKLALRSVLVEDTKLAEMAKDRERRARQKKRSVTEAGEDGPIQSFVGFKTSKKRKILDAGEEERTRKRLGAVEINDQAGL